MKRNLLLSALVFLVSICSLVPQIHAFGKSDDEYERIAELQDELSGEASLSYFF